VVHIPDGYINAATSAGAGIVAAGGLSIALHKAARVLDERRVPLAGLMAAFIFAAQMLNFPVVAGTSGHIIGGVLAAVLVGPWTASLCLTVVLFVQALFADGGLTALGLNVTNLALVSCLGGYLIFLGLRWILPKTRGSVVVASGIAAGASVLLSALAFTLEYALGGNAPISVSTVAGAMVGVHALIAVGEGLITAAVVGLVSSVRPDLVFGLVETADAPVPASPALQTSASG
jgi:cobalt/nickel transport system permease protein